MHASRRGAPLAVNAWAWLHGPQPPAVSATAGILRSCAAKTVRREASWYVYRGLPRSALGLRWRLLPAALAGARSRAPMPRGKLWQAHEDAALRELLKDEVPGDDMSR